MSFKFAVDTLRHYNLDVGRKEDFHQALGVRGKKPGESMMGMGMLLAEAASGGDIEVLQDVVAAIEVPTLAFSRDFFRHAS